ncbi:hypothetical protein JYP52_21160 [Nitratireductor aquibiodomus]|uniref:hypothetical protein n=1 Tax=Nitratireductor aquibiodomus TaxID=204799 RepID=UPI0019D39FAA|nr:hypothetical protein [Nitratireductor aquibiodomus]MBN7763653.1 hypothetical protein [Nitratireductor aquibiodomus]
MKQIRLKATPPVPGLSIDLGGVYKYDRDPNGADLLCGHCDAVMFPAHPTNIKGDTMHIEGVECKSCGGHNTLATASL